MPRILNKSYANRIIDLHEAHVAFDENGHADVSDDMLLRLQRADVAYALVSEPTPLESSQSGPSQDAAPALPTSFVFRGSEEESGPSVRASVPREAGRPQIRTLADLERDKAEVAPPPQPTQPTQPVPSVPLVSEAAKAPEVQAAAMPASKEPSAVSASTEKKVAAPKKATAEKPAAKKKPAAAKKKTAAKKKPATKAGRKSGTRRATKQTVKK